MIKELLATTMLGGAVIIPTGAQAWNVGYHHGGHNPCCVPVAPTPCCASAPQMAQTGYQASVQAHVVYEPRLRYRTVLTPTYAWVVPQVSYTLQPVMPAPVYLPAHPCCGY